MQSFNNRMDVVRFLSFTHKPCCCMLNFLKFSLVSTEGNLKAKSYSSLSERGQESIQGFGLLEWWEGVAWNLCLHVRNSASGATGAVLSCLYGSQGEWFENALSSAHRGSAFFGKPWSRPRECFMHSICICVYTSRHITHAQCLFLSKEVRVLSGTSTVCQWPWMFWWRLPVLCIARRWLCWYRENVFVITSSITVWDEIMIKTSKQFC